MADDDFQEGEPKERRKARRPDDDDDDDAPRRNKRRSHADDGGVGVVIPYRNGMALTAYYLGVFGLISCFLGLGFLGIVPFILGILGLLNARKDPEARGSVHAWVGILLGALEMLTGCALIGFIAYTGMR
jgi:hypothetical protein